MKTVLMALLGFSALITTGRGQSPSFGSGLYRSVEDFRNHRLTLAVDCKTATHKLRFHEFNGKPYLTVIHGGKPYQVAKDSLFGYCDCDGVEYRFASDNQHYPILNPGKAILLCKVEQPAVGKNSGYVHLFFSPTAAAPIQPLTLLAAKKAFPNNHRFHDLLDAQIQNGDLTAYDAMHHMTKLNWLLRQSQAATVSH